MSRDEFVVAAKQVSQIDGLRDRAIVAREFCKFFAAFNPRFNAVRFCKGAGVELVERSEGFIFQELCENYGNRWVPGTRR